MKLLIAIVIAFIAGILAKLLFGYFDLTRPYADPLAFAVAVLVFFNRIGMF